MTNILGRNITKTHKQPLLINIRVVTMSPTAEEKEKIVEACTKARQAKMRAKLERLRKEQEKPGEETSGPDKSPDEEPEEKKLPGQYKDKESCEKEGYYWYDGKCHKEPEPKQEQMKPKKEEEQPSEKEKEPEEPKKEDGQEKPHEEEKPKPDECGTKEKCLKHGYEWDPATGCKYPGEAPSKQAGKQPEE